MYTVGCVNETHSQLEDGQIGTMDTTQSPKHEFRQTAQRRMILETVQEAESHLTAGEIFERVRKRDARIGYGTVYRTLHLLAEHGLIQELTFADQASRYDRRCDRHDHVHCSVCGALVDVDVPEALMARHVAEERSGFSIVRHHTVFVGVCPICQNSATGGEPKPMTR